MWRDCSCSKTGNIRNPGAIHQSIKPTSCLYRGENWALLGWGWKSSQKSGSKPGVQLRRETPRLIDENSFQPLLEKPIVRILQIFHSSKPGLSFTVGYRQWPPESHASPQLALFSSRETNSDLASMGQVEWLLTCPFSISVTTTALTAPIVINLFRHPEWLCQTRRPICCQTGV